MLELPLNRADHLPDFGEFVCDREQGYDAVANEPQHCLSLDDLHDEIKKQVMVRVRGGFKYQMEWYPYEPPFFRKYEIAPDGTRKRYL